ncbi:PleD family two-component system response regulator [Leptolyngbya sp. CCNP1308]|uniref:PleD family two-component system response regulator n=1 Tax=Leptolyngbya sp. CCNP1308 TaxID=3110255 RepID=UPI002B1ED363|nr:PleD family two-component system response regulator [Leptolyngbya sp. CCNP1308]MEA5448729.1 PleD family two-component system response regulator [Leptolyngbya sp. CCNP1308]
MSVNPDSAVILVADDDPFIRHMLTSYLEREGYQVIEAPHGEAALDLYFYHLPDLVLLDALMPVVDGFEVCRRLQALTQGNLAPVLMITGLEDEKSVDQAFEIGVVDYVTKPINWAVLRQRVRRLILQHRLEIQLREANHRLQKLTMIDSLTQVANRRRFDEYLLQEWGRGVRESLPLSLVICDIDNFKNYNDHYGHQAGDRCLQEVAKTLNQCISRPADLVTRYGGEEFAVILPNTTMEGATTVSQRLVQGIQQRELPHDTAPQAIVTVSCGVANVLPMADYLPSDLVFTADQALYQAKAQGRNQYQAIYVMPPAAKQSMPPGAASAMPILRSLWPEA